MIKYYIRPYFECQNSRLIANVKIGIWTSKYDIRPHFECQNRILSVKIQYSAPVRVSKYDYECQNTIFGPISNRILKNKIRYWPYFKCQNSGMIANVKIGF